MGCGAYGMPRMAVDDELQRYLGDLPKKVRAKLSGVIKGEADNLSSAQQASLRSLEQPPDETGDLEASCTVVPGKDDLEFVVQAGGDTTTVKGYDHAVGFEYGTAKQPARPFFWSTYRARRAGIEQNIQDAVAEALK
jgi:hypothetical protein